MKSIEEHNGDLVAFFQEVIDSMNAHEEVNVSLRHLDVSIILTSLKTINYYHKTFEDQMKQDFAKIKSNK